MDLRTGAAQRCSAADEKDPKPCDGPWTAVTTLTADGTEITGCLQHSARLLASLEGSRLHPLAALAPWAVDVYCRAAELPPFAWLIGL
ncbi:hypothetical protein AB0C51_09300 [Streptomyces pathocidini]|uniref:Uncharacterized protein n=1 Tax=Streptomyces pathocidini TaxID=1650571 RepID=A0ABW7UJV1_9ACTN|nr:hypothetical protein [Streptomyces pathocidini]